MATRDYYGILQVTPAAEPEVIEAAFKRLAFKYHPDRNLAVAAAGMMRDLNEAYETLGNPERRRQYDARRTVGVCADPPPKPARSRMWGWIVTAALIIGGLYPYGHRETRKGPDDVKRLLVGEWEKESENGSVITFGADGHFTVLLGPGREPWGGTWTTNGDEVELAAYGLYHWLTDPQTVGKPYKVTLIDIDTNVLRWRYGDGKTAAYKRVK